MFKYYAAAYFGVVLTAVSQVLFKIGSDRSNGRHVLRTYLNPFSLVAYLLLFVVTLLSVFAYSRLPLKMAAVVLPVNYVLVGIFCVTFLHERLQRSHLLGAGLVVVGMVVFNL